jgi:hypothetical protein
MQPHTRRRITDDGRNLLGVFLLWGLACPCRGYGEIGMIARICVTLVFVLWPFMGLAYGLLDGDWSLFGGFVMFWIVLLASAGFTGLLVLIWKKGTTDADKY